MEQFLPESNKIIKKLKEEIKSFEFHPHARKVGFVTKVQDGVVTIDGLNDAMAGEMLRLKESIYALVLNLDEDSIGAIVLGDYTKIKEGESVDTTGKILEVPVGEALLGRVVNPLGEPLDGKGAIKHAKFYPVEKLAPGVIKRAPVDSPVQTGVKAIDAMIPIGRGQRELIIGDRQTGKTALALDTIINQKDKNLLCIYVAIGQRESKIARLVAQLEKHDALDNTIVVVSGAADPAALTYIAPYAGCAMGEYFMDKGKDVLVVYDDLTKHAWSYRQISLLLRRPPGREAYPGDVFYLHSRLLERAAKLDKKYGGGSLTALPIIETQLGDISAYIPTNVISITDGQIYLESDLFYAGTRPALNVGLSVSRVGSSAQTKIMKKIAGKLRLDLAQYRELAAFAQFGSDLDKETRERIERGRRTVEILKQGQYEPMPLANQIMIIYAAVNGYLDAINVGSIKETESKLHEYMKTQKPKVLDLINDEKELTEDIEKEIKDSLDDFLETLPKEYKIVEEEKRS
ncbi:MAG: hypothetical protein ACD_63C00077G0004 [uncultured bacterium]|nr:MAG: hypothetical protein ACD_63C00077G0004 [uncultured bacterium]